MKISVIGRKSRQTISAVSAVLLPLAILFRDPRSGLADIVLLGLLLELSRFPHYLPGAVFEGFGPFAFLAGLLTCGQFALCHEPSLPHAGRLGYPVDYKLRSSEYLIRMTIFERGSETRVGFKKRVIWGPLRYLSSNRRSQCQR
jgi:hypothetical protein